jgi:demethylmenaquinone methyltransferase/2-methoxy-6-polyprenyl-1,4-benzoquinol methylase
VETDRLLEEQRHYYRERALEYDDWWFRRGRYELEPAAAGRWFADCAEVESELARFGPAGAVLELACGTGLWTRHLAPRAATLTAVDASAEMIALNRERVGDDAVEYVQADVFDWRPERTYDACFFGFWLSHVPEQRFDEFWAVVRQALSPGGRVFFVDSGRGDRAHTRSGGGEVELRRLLDGREFRIVKRYHEPRALERRLAGLGFELAVRHTAHGSLLYGS